MINKHNLYLGNNLDILKTIADNSIDAIVTDPPYGISFMNKKWDYDVPSVELWKEVLRVLKPGGHAIVICGTRTQHRMAVNLEDAGFEIRDIIAWLYGCYSSDTEVLTNNGWKTYEQLTENDNILQWNSESNQLSWIKPINKFQYEINSEMVLFSNRHTEQLVTKNHTVYGKIRKHSKSPKPEKYEKIQAVDIKKHWQIDLPLAGNLINGIIENYAYIIGWWLTDAWRHKDDKAVMFSQSKPNTLKKLKDYLDSNNIRYSEYIKNSPNIKHRNEHTFYVTGDIAKFLLENYYDRELKWNILLWDKKSRELLLKGLMDGDGSYRENQYSRIFWSTKKDRLDIFQALCLSLNMRSHIDYKKGCVYFNIKHNSTQLQFKHKKETQSYQGTVWCLQTETGAFVVRRNGKAFISGNSGFPKSTNIAKNIDKIKGNKRELVGVGRSGSGETHTRTMSALTKEGKEVFGGEYEITKGISEYEGLGSAIKPAMELCTLCRKPLTEKNLAENVLKWNTGGLNIDACRISTREVSHRIHKTKSYEGVHEELKGMYKEKTNWSMCEEGRYPANVIHDGSEEVLNLFPNSKSSKYKGEGSKSGGLFNKSTGKPAGMEYGDNGSAARFFYCAKASKKERNLGIKQAKTNNHPTVKPLALMEYLCKLITPKEGLILDPFMGSGTTGIAAIKNNYSFIGIEREEDYINIAKQRIDNAVIENTKNIQLSIIEEESTLQNDN